MATHRHSAKPLTARQARGHHASAGVQSQSGAGQYLPIFMFVGIIIFFAVMIVVKFYNQ